ncbi:hypothetical protein SPPR111872_19965 [Sphingobacterium prati]
MEKQVVKKKHHGLVLKNIDLDAFIFLQILRNIISAPE